MSWGLLVTPCPVAACSTWDLQQLHILERIPSAHLDLVGQWTPSLLESVTNWYTGNHHDVNQGQKVTRLDPLLLPLPNTTEWRIKPMVVVWAINGCSQTLLGHWLLLPVTTKLCAWSYILFVYVMKSHFIIHCFLSLWDYKQGWVWKRPCFSFPKILEAWIQIYVWLEIFKNKEKKMRAKFTVSSCS